MVYPPLWSPEVEDRLRAEAHSMDAQEVPEEIQFCKQCVVSNQRPRIVFDDKGVCSACRYAASKQLVDWTARHRALQELCDRHRKSRGWDVIVPCSGGKDSSTVAHRLKTDFGMNPLCVKWAPFAYTDIGFKNFNSFVHAGFDVMTAWPDGLMHRKLSRLAFEYLGDAWQPFAYGQLYYAMHMAVKFDISLVMFGENGEAEYGGDPAANDKPCWDFEDWDRIYLKGADIYDLCGKGLETGAIEHEDIGRLNPFYSLPDKIHSRIEQGIRPEQEFHWFSHYTHWHPQANYYHASQNTGFEANPGRSEGTYSKYASLDDRMDGFHFYLAYVKFGIGRATSDAAHEVRDGEITREEAKALVRRYDGEFPKRYFEEFKNYLDLDDVHFWRVVKRYRKPHVWRREGNDWKLRKTVYDEGVLAA